MRKPMSLYAVLLVPLWGVGCQSIVGLEDRVYDPLVTTSPACEEYCTDVMANCTGANAVYSKRENCLGVCRLLTPGDPFEPGGNTVACREAQAKLAKETMEPSVHCPNAGPGGNKACGSNCASYCRLYAAACEAVSPTPAHCEAACGALLDTEKFDVAADHAGDTLQCRLVHVSSAANDPAGHCPHSKIANPTDWCVSEKPMAATCPDYCRAVMATCQGPQAVYESAKQCADVCAVLPVGEPGDQKLDTVTCRKYHSFNSVAAPVAHCPHAGPGGDGHCGSDNCPSYCLLFKHACGEAFRAKYADDDAKCLAECQGMLGGPKDSGYAVATAKTGNTLQCRLLHAARAESDPAACASAAGGGDCM
ncbi:MAG TPA: hypothetical protein VJT73_01200 [Polyangiaceae bacterium]|nr:hypothetical protein [Polyangiaceae bacterium]